jgi:two-component system chemotaxis response regulator CheB
MVTADHQDQWIVVLGASAGGVEALSTVIGALPAEFPAAVFVVLHLAPAGLSLLPEILGRAGQLPVRHAIDGAPIEPGNVYVAPPDHHLIVDAGVMRVTEGPIEHRARPALDPLFRSAAESYGPRVVGVVLSGMLDDGATGLQAVKQHGGATIVQDPDDAMFRGMPVNAVRLAAPDHVVAATGIAPLLLTLVGRGTPVG